MQLWLLFDPRRALIGLFAFLLVLALLIHFILLGTAKFNWLDNSKVQPTAVAGVSSYESTPPGGPASAPQGTSGQPAMQRATAPQSAPPAVDNGQ